MIHNYKFLSGFQGYLGIMNGQTYASASFYDPHILTEDERLTRINERIRIDEQMRNHGRMSHEQYMLDRDRLGKIISIVIFILVAIILIMPLAAEVKFNHAQKLRDGYLWEKAEKQFNEFKAKYEDRKKNADQIIDGRVNDIIKNPNLKWNN